jgi:quercetin dioxygenase-like cupin family protein
MNDRPLVVTPADYPRAMRVVGEEITLLASGSGSTAYEIFMQHGPQGSGPPPHSHPWDEAFFVTEGEVEFGYGDQTQLARPGTLVHLPAGTMHWFRFGKDGGKMISVTSRVGASRMFADFDREIAPEKPDLAALVKIGERHGLTVGG